MFKVRQIRGDLEFHCTGLSTGVDSFILRVDIQQERESKDAGALLAAEINRRLAAFGDAKATEEKDAEIGKLAKQVADLKERLAEAQKPKAPPPAPADKPKRAPGRPRKTDAE